MKWSGPNPRLRALLKSILALAVMVLALGGCTTSDSDGDRNGSDPDGGGDATGSADLPQADQQAETTPSCPYPDGPYDFSGEGDIVGPMNWPNALSGADETLAADLAAIRCDPNVHSIFVQIGAFSCGYCPARFEEIGDSRDHWETYGAKWIFIVIDASSPSQADEYVEQYGVSFGWRTDDSDNSLGAGTIGDFSAFTAQPWTGVIRTSDMVLVYDEPDDSYLDLQGIAQELAGE